MQKSVQLQEFYCSFISLMIISLIIWKKSILLKNRLRIIKSSNRPVKEVSEC